MPLGSIATVLEVTEVNKDMAHNCSIRVPMLIMHGDEDTVNGVEGSKRLMHYSAAIDKKLIVKRGEVAPSEAFRVLNMGIGMVLFVRAGDVDEVLRGCRAAGEEPLLVGDVVAADERVRLT